MAVYAAEHSRESIFHAIYDRRTYATSGVRILLDFQLDRHPMGSEVKTRTPPLVSVDVVGTAPIARVEIEKKRPVVFRVAAESGIAANRVARQGVSPRLKSLSTASVSFKPTAKKRYRAPFGR